MASVIKEYLIDPKIQLHMQLCNIETFKELILSSEDIVV